MKARYKIKAEYDIILTLIETKSVRKTLSAIRKELKNQIRIAMIKTGNPPPAMQKIKINVAPKGIVK